MADLKEWVIEMTIFEKPVLIGKIYNDEKGRFPDGHKVHTSALKKIDFEEMKAYTKNSVYNLK